MFSAQNFSMTLLLTGDPELAVVGGMVSSGNPITTALLLTVAAGDGPSTTTPKPRAQVAAPPKPVVVEGVQVPALDRDQEVAEATLASRGLVADIVNVESDEPVGDVIGSEPPEDTVVRRGSTVRVFVSIGLLVPNVVGLAAEEAVRTLEAAGFDAKVVVSDKHAGKPDVVVEQDVEAGTHEGAGVTVVVVVNKSRDGLHPVESND